METKQTKDIRETIDPALMEAFLPLIGAMQEINFQMRWKAFEELNAFAPKGGIVFAGDSITEGFSIHEFFPRNLPLYNRGINGISAKQLLSHSDAHFDGLKPGKIFILIGTNDLGGGDPVEEVAGTIREIALSALSSAPGVKVFLLSVYPVKPAETGRELDIIAKRTNEGIRDLNRRIREIAEETGAVYIDVYPALADEKGVLKGGYTADGLHLSTAGYRSVVEVLSPYVTSDYKGGNGL
jgi:lysophospholipase L1-like esterase